MTTIHTLVLIAHVLIAVLMIGAVLLQRGKGAEAGAAFGAGASGTVFGARGSANFLSRTTAVLATLFFVTSLSLAYLTAQRPVTSESLMETQPAVDVELDITAAPAAPAEEGDLPAVPVPAEEAPAE